MGMERINERKRKEIKQERRKGLIFLSNFILYLFINYDIMERHGSMEWKWNASSKKKEWKQHKNVVKV